MWVTAEVERRGRVEDVIIQPWEMLELDNDEKLSHADRLHRAIDVLLATEPLVARGRYFQVTIHA